MLVSEVKAVEVEVDLLRELVAALAEVLVVQEEVA